MRKFDTPADFFKWLHSQSADVQKHAARLVLALADLGIRGDIAAHMAYDAVQLSQEMAVKFDANATRH